MRATVKCDIDGVLNDMVYVMLCLYQKETGIELKYEDCVEYDFSCYGKEAAEALNKYFYDKEMWNALVPPRYAVEYFKKIYEEFDTYIVTATSPENFAWKVEWFKRWYPFVDEERIVRLCKKKMMQTDFSIDDYDENLIEDFTHRILINAPWNHADKYGMYEIHKANDLKEAYGIMKEICAKEDKEFSKIYRSLMV